jgi:hypothetical protein
VLIIAFIFAVFSGCGYKAAPIYDDGSKQEQIKKS